MCDRVAIVNRGTIAAIDAPERLKKTIQSVQSIVVSFDHASPRTSSMRSVSLSMVNDAVKEGDKFRLYTEDPATVIESVMEYARTRNSG